MQYLWSYRKICKQKRLEYFNVYKSADVVLISFLDNAPNYLAGCVIQKEINVNKPGGGGKGGGWPFDILEVADRSEDEVQDPEKKTNAILLKEPMKFEIQMKKTISTAIVKKQIN